MRTNRRLCQRHGEVARYVIQLFLEMLFKRRWQGYKITHHAVLPAQEAKYGSLPDPLPEILQAALLQLGVTSLYDHQSQAIERIRAGSHVVVATPTASGKSLIYNLAVGEGLLQDPEQRALYLFPIKALTRDQLEALNTFLGAFRSGENKTIFQAAVYDGDTSPYQRTKIRGHHPHILLTNPDMLHYALLPYHAKWEAFWKQLKFVIVDEMHTYRGVFGSHVAQIFRRLQRICRFYGSNPQFILLSATIANPRELAQQLIGNQQRAIDVIYASGAPQARRHFVFLESEEGQGSHVSGLAAQLLAKAAEAGLKTIAFTQARKITELIHMSVLRTAPQLAKRVSSYRAGFLPEERRVIEQKLASGELSAVISTSALEMGIDIGGLDLCILVGYPGTVMTTWQRGGRVGRSGRESAIILLPQYDALDQYIVHHPETFLQLRYEIAVTDPLNEEILKAHIPCAAAELPLERAEIDTQEPAFRHQVEALARTGKLLQTADGKQWLSAAFHPHRQVDIRSAGPAYVILKNSDSDRHIPLGKSEGIRALKECHPGAIYLHRGETYQVQSLDLANRVIRVEPSRASYFTRVKSEKETEILDILASKPVGNFLARLGRVKVTETIIGYEKRRLFSQELLGMDALDLPQQTFETVGFWIEIEPEVVKQIQAAKLHFMGGIHAVEHALISMFPLFALCDRNDIGGISIPLHPQVEKAAIFIYDGYPGGIGLAVRGYEMILPLLEKTRDLIASCSCQDGCPACIHSPKCGSGNKPLDKEAALSILKYLLGEWNFSSPLTPSDDSEQRVAIPAAHPSKASPPPRIGFFDIETQRLADEVGGWQNKHLMKLSVAVLFDTHTDAFEVFREAEVTSLLQRLQALDLVVGFNIASFDYEVLRAYSPFNLHKLPTFDILKEIQQVLGFRLSLAHLAEHNLGQPKMADGVQAVTWFRQGNWDALIKYCTMDVRLTRDLFYRGIETGHLLYQDRQGRSLRIPTPWHLENLLHHRKAN
jgi:DEAD/DEAH box helicase domain-containing protein